MEKGSPVFCISKPGTPPGFLLFIPRGDDFMKASNKQWSEQTLESPIPELLREIEIYETEIELRKQGKMDEKLFAETRLRRGAYGQRYDNGQRWDGKETRALSYPSSATELTKGPNT